MHYCGFNIEPLCSDVCGDHRRPQTLAEICKNMGICCGYRAVAAREKYPGFMLFIARIQHCDDHICHCGEYMELLGRAVGSNWHMAMSVNYSPIYILIDHAYVHSPWFTTVSVVFMRRLTKMDGPNDYILIQHCHGERTNPHIKTKPMGFRPHIPHFSLPLLPSGPTLIWDMYHNWSNFSHKILNSYTAKFSFYWIYFCVWFTISLNCDVISLRKTDLWKAST